MSSYLCSACKWRADGAAAPAVDVGAVMARVAELEIKVRLDNLARNLRDAGGLCAAFWQGHEQREHERLYSDHGYRECDDWYPGHAIGSTPAIDAAREGE